MRPGWEVLADIGDVLVEFCDAFFLFAPILPEFRHSGEAFLFKTEFLQILLQGVARCLKSAVRQRAKPFDAHIQADSVSLVFRRNALKLRLDGHAPTVSPTAHCDGLGLSFNEPTPPVLHPTDTRGFPEESKCIGCLPKFSKTVVKKASHCVRMFENNAKYHNVYPR